MGRTTRPRSLEPEELIPVLRREGNEQCFRIAELQDALTQQNYSRVSELMDSLGGSLSEHAADKEKRTLILDTDTGRTTRKAIEALQQTRPVHK